MYFKNILYLIGLAIILSGCNAGKKGVSGYSDLYPAHIIEQESQPITAKSRILSGTAIATYTVLQNTDIGLELPINFKISSKTTTIAWEKPIPKDVDNQIAEVVADEPVEVKPYNTNAMWGFISGLIALLLVYLIIVPIVFGTISIWLGIKALKQMTNEPDKYRGKGLAIAGMAMGTLGIMIIVAVPFFILFFS